MKGIFGVIALVVFAAGMVLAQSQQSPAEETAHQNQTVTMEGCLGHGSHMSTGNYTLLSHDGQTFQVQTSDKAVEKMIGHRVSVTGVENAGPASTGNAPSEIPNGATNTGAEKILTKAQVTDVASTCDEGTTKAKP